MLLFRVYPINTRNWAIQIFFFFHFGHSSNQSVTSGKSLVSIFSHIVHITVPISEENNTPDILYKGLVPEEISL